jgi:REP-associated tyrosine transposase
MRRARGELGGDFAHFWQHRFYDFNIWTDKKRIEKLRYMHRNPVVRGLVASPEQWDWSSHRFYSTGEAGILCVNSAWPKAEMKVRS